jgi:hypothetical protein
MSMNIERHRTYFTSAPRVLDAVLDEVPGIASVVVRSGRPPKCLEGSIDSRFRTVQGGEQAQIPRPSPSASSILKGFINALSCSPATARRSGDEHKEGWKQAERLLPLPPRRPRNVRQGAGPAGACVKRIELVHPDIRRVRTVPRLGAAAHLGVS